MERGFIKHSAEQENDVLFRLMISLSVSEPLSASVESKNKFSLMNSKEQMTALQSLLSKRCKKPAKKRLIWRKLSKKEKYLSGATYQTPSPPQWSNMNPTLTKSEIANAPPKTVKGIFCSPDEAIFNLGTLGTEQTSEIPDLCYMISLWKSWAPWISYIFLLLKGHTGWSLAIAGTICSFSRSFTMPLPLSGKRLSTAGLRKKWKYTKTNLDVDQRTEN